MVQIGQNLEYVHIRFRFIPIQIYTWRVIMKTSLKYTVVVACFLVTFAVSATVPVKP